MLIELEAKILNVDPEETTSVILAAGGRRVQPATLMRRRVYDIVAGDESRWIRLRDTGAEVTVAVEEIAHDGIDGTRETEVRVDDFDMAGQLLSRLGFTAKSYQENRRTSFLLDGARLEIDEWPLIPAYLEIEGDSRETCPEGRHTPGSA
jgi:adenylate cyclase, class 2